MWNEKKLEREGDGAKVRGKAEIDNAGGPPAPGPGPRVGPNSAGHAPHVTRELTPGSCGSVATSQNFIMATALSLAGRRTYGDDRNPILSL